MSQGEEQEGGQRNESQERRGMDFNRATRTDQQQVQVDLNILSEKLGDGSLDDMDDHRFSIFMEKASR